MIFIIKKMHKNNNNSIKHFFLSDKNVSMIFNLIVNNFTKRNLKPTNQSVIKQLKDIHLNIMNLVFQSKDYYLQLENITNSSDIIKFLNRKVIDRCNIDFTKILQNENKSNQNIAQIPHVQQLPQNNNNMNNSLSNQFKTISNNMNLNNETNETNKSPYKTTDYSNMSVQNALDKILHERNNVNVNSTNNTKLLNEGKQTKISTLISKTNKSKMEFKINESINKKNENVNSIENIRLRIKQKQKQNQTNNQKDNNNKLLDKINQLKSIQESITATKTNINNQTVENKLFYSVQKNWGGFWNNITENKIIIERQLVKSPHNCNKYSYIIDVGKPFTKIRIKQLIIPLNRDNPMNIDLMLIVMIKNFQIEFPMKLQKQVNNLLYYECNEVKNITNIIKKNNKLLVEINNYDRKIYQNNEIDVFTISTITMNSEGYFTILFNEINYQSNKIIKNDTLLFQNINFNNFIKHNQNVTKEDVLLLENWFNNKEHCISKQNNHFIIFYPTESQFKFLQNEQFKTIFNNIQKTNIGFAINKSTQHLVDIEII